MHIKVMNNNMSIIMLFLNHYILTVTHLYPFH